MVEANDIASAKQILETASVAGIKALGKDVIGFKKTAVAE